jgi:glycerol-3-phosphate acyltransferase PlsX
LVRVALDLMGGDDAPSAVVDAALLVADTQPDVEILLVGPVDVAERLLAERGAAGRVRLVAASQVVGMDEDGARAVRAKKDATVRVTHRLVRDGEADAAVSTGSTGATLAAAVLILGRAARRRALAVVVPTPAGQVVLLDAGATLEGSVEQLVEHAVLGSAYAAALGLDNPRVGLLNVGHEPGKGDPVRKEAFTALGGAPIRFIGNVEGHDVAHGGRADVVVTDGFTGNVLLKGLEGALRRTGAELPVSAVLLGVDGVCVVGHGAASPADIAACVGVAARAVEEGLLARLATALGLGLGLGEPAGVIA